MKLLLPIVAIICSSLVISAQTANDLALSGLRGKVKLVETWTRETDRSGKPAYPAQKESTDEYDITGNLVRSTHHVTAGRTIYFTLDGQRVSRYEQIGPGIKVEVPVGTAEESGRAKTSGDSRYEYRYTYIRDSAGRVVQIDEHRNDGTLWQVRKFTYDEAGRLASETVTKDGRLSHGDLYKYDANGVLIERGSVLYLISGEKEVTPFRFSRHKLDRQGNWIERTMSQGEGPDAEIIAVETRKITYH